VEEEVEIFKFKELQEVPEEVMEELEAQEQPRVQEELGQQAKVLMEVE
jgi:hypothetical protein